MIASWAEVADRRRAQDRGGASQLVGRYGVKRGRARDRLPLTSRFLMMVLSHMYCVMMCQREEHAPLRFPKLFTH